MSGVTRWEVAGDLRTGLGARYRMLFRVGAAEVGGLVEVVEFDAPCDFAWTSVTGLDHRGRWRLREAPGGRTRVEFRLAYVVAGAGLSGWLAERVAAPTVVGSRAPHPPAARAPGRARAAARPSRAAPGEPRARLTSEPRSARGAVSRRPATHSGFDGHESRLGARDAKAGVRRAHGMDQLRTATSPSRAGCGCDFTRRRWREVSSLDRRDRQRRRTLLAPDEAHPLPTRRLHADVLGRDADRLGQRRADLLAHRRQRAGARSPRWRRRAGSPSRGASAWPPWSAAARASRRRGSARRCRGSAGRCRPARPRRAARR